MEDIKDTRNVTDGEGDFQERHSDIESWYRRNQVLIWISGILVAILLTKPSLHTSLILVLVGLGCWGLWQAFRKALQNLRISRLPKFETDEPDKIVEFNRDEELKRLTRWLLNCQEGRNLVLAITGPSGVGKSWLVKRLPTELKKMRREKTEMFWADFSVPKTSVQSILGDLNNSVQKLKKDTQAIVILDQFEICLDAIADELGKNAKSLRSLGDHMRRKTVPDETLLRKLKGLLELKQTFKHLSIVVVVRDDRFYDLRILGELGQIPYWAFEVRGISAKTNTEAQGGLDDVFSNPVQDSECRDKLLHDLQEQDKTVLPVKAKIVFLMLRSMSRQSSASGFSRFMENLFLSRRRRKFLVNPEGLTMHQYDYFGGVSGLIEEYFNRVIDSAGMGLDNVTKDVLCVLSLDGRVKGHYLCSEIAEISYHSNQDVNKAVDHFHKNCGIVRRSHHQCALKHDYFAARFKELSGRFMRPVVRDNLAYAHDALVLSRKQHVSKKRDPKKELAELTARSVLQVAKILFVAFFMFRLVNFDVFPSGQQGSLLGIIKYTAYRVDTSWPWDWHYLPICLAQLLWTIYLIELGRKIFARVDEKRSRRVLTGTLMFFVFLGMISTAFVPGFWLAWIGVNALLVGFKFNRLGKIVSRHTSVGNRYSRIGFWTMLHSLPVIAIGLLVYPKFRWDLPKLAGLLNDNLDYFTAFSQLEYSRVFYAVVPLLIYFVFMYKWQASRDSAVEFVGLYNRTRAFVQRPTSIDSVGKATV